MEEVTNNKLETKETVFRGDIHTQKKTSKNSWDIKKKSTAVAAAVENKSNKDKNHTDNWETRKQVIKW